MAISPNLSSIRALAMASEIPQLVSMLPEFELKDVPIDKLYKMETYPPTWVVHVNTIPNGNLFDSINDRNFAIMTRIDSYEPYTLNVRTKYTYCWARYGYATGKSKYFDSMEDAVINMKTKYRMGVKT
jgi:hypothetical protein